MTTSATSDTTNGPTTGVVKTIIYPVKDLAQAKALFSALMDSTPYVDEVYYVGFRAGAQDIGLDPNGHKKGMTGPVNYWQVDDIQAHLARLQAAGAEVQQPPTHVGNGRLIATVKDADGNLIGLLQDSQ